MALETIKDYLPASEREGEIPEATWQTRRLPHKERQKFPGCCEDYHWSLILPGALDWVGKEGEEEKIEEGEARKILLHDLFQYEGQGKWLI